MPDKLTAARISELLADLGITDILRAAVIGDAATGRDECGGLAVEAIGPIATAADLPQGLRADITIVGGQLQNLPRPEAEHILARLRDVHSRRVLLLLDDHRWSADALRALGFLEKAADRAGTRVFLYDADEYNQPREWNNPTHWANPDNFSKYRW